jgi:uncharacterized protein YdeI (YjbR/CyaY-like superfamily)
MATTEELDPRTPEEWRAWLEANGRSATAIWFVVHHKGSATTGIPFDEVVEHALCYGWIDGQARRRDDLSHYVRFSPRSPKSTWSKVNRARVERLVERGLMTDQGQAMVDLAKRTGTWDLLAEAQNGIVPADLQALLDGEMAARNFAAMSPSSKRAVLEGIARAKRPETRQRRLVEAVEQARQDVRRSGPAAPSAP